MSKVLIVEDERIIANDIKTTLNRWGHEVSDIVSSGEEALQSVEDVRPDVVLMDIKIKGRMDGIETAQKMRKLYKVPVIYLTAHTDDEMINRAKISEPFGYIVKPFEERSLHTTVEMSTYKSQMERKEEERMLQMQRLTDAALNLRINSQSSIEKVLHTIAKQARHIIGAHQAVVLLSLEQNWAKLINATSFSDKYEAWRTYKIETDCSGIYSLVCKNNRPVCMTQADLEAHLEWQDFLKKSKKYPPMRGLLGSPLIGHNGKNIGLIYLSDKYQGEFSLEDEMILLELAHMASSVIENAHLYHDVEESRMEIEQAKQRLRETADALAHSNQELEQFAFVASHDLKEPLKVINGYVQLLQKKYKGKVLDESSEKFMQNITEGVARMTDLINSLLEYSRIGKKDIVLEELNCTTCVEQAIANLQVAIKDADAQVTYDQLPVILGDKILITRLFQNLIANGIKFHGEKAPKIHISKESNDHEWIISVRDNGIGIKKEDFIKIFDIFERLHSRTKFQGSGIGLAICKKIVEQHGGRIGIKSELDLGSTFSFTFPLHSKPA